MNQPRGNMGIIAVGMSVEERRSELKRMQGIATALLLAMTALLALTRSARFDLLWLPYLRAFAEAGMVGACADWFAVVALFRRPLGLPIPHTGIVPANQHRIAEALGRFVANNFLTRKSVNRKLAEIDVVGLLARWMADPKHSKAIAATCGRALPEILQSMPPGRIQEFAAVIARRSVETDSRGAGCRTSARSIVGQWRGAGPARSRDRLRWRDADAQQGSYSKTRGD